MPMYYIRLRDKDGLLLDEQGAEFRSEKKAGVEAMLIARETYARMTVNGENSEGTRIELARFDGDVVATVSLDSFAGSEQQ